MRYIDINAIIESVDEAVARSLSNAHEGMSRKNDADKQMAADRGNAIWRDVKPFLENASSRKCWYTESKNPGFPLEVEHYRPKGRKTDSNGRVLHWYWFLVFKIENYRLSCDYPNSLNRNEVLGATGGKHTHFPLVQGSHATDEAGIANEQPVLLDPCNQEDIALLEFQVDGRPIVSPRFSHDAVSCRRVSESNLLLNIDFPTFNGEREELYHTVKKLVERGDEYYANGNPALQDAIDDLTDLMGETEPYTKAAECYVRCFRDRPWIDRLFT